MRESKECFYCGGIYFRPETYTDAQWEARKYCGVVCAGKAGARRLHHKEEPPEEPHREAVVEAGERVVAELLGPLLPLDPVAAQTVHAPPMLENPPAAERAPIMRELRIVRVGPNPRMVVCEYFELAQRRTCTVYVKRTDKYVRGMRMTMPEPVSEADFVRPWIYQGAAPRHRGRW